MLGTIVNTLAIIVGSLLGIVFRGGIPNKYQVTIMQAISLSVILIGLKMAFKTDAILLVIFSLVIGSILGEFLRIEERLENLGKRLETKFAKAGDGIAKGFVVASLVCPALISEMVVSPAGDPLRRNWTTMFWANSAPPLNTRAVSTIVAMGRALNIHVVAEGVETEAQRKELSDCGCDFLQGYLLGKPMPVSDFESQFDFSTKDNVYRIKTR